MGRVRTFRGHEGVVPPTGLRPRSAAPAAPAEDEIEEVEVVETETPEVEVENSDAPADELNYIDVPDSSWKVSDIDAFAELYEITFPDGVKKAGKLEAITAWAASVPDAIITEED